MCIHIDWNVHWRRSFTKKKINNECLQTLWYPAVRNTATNPAVGCDWTGPYVGTLAMEWGTRAKCAQWHNRDICVMWAEFSAETATIQCTIVITLVSLFSCLKSYMGSLWIEIWEGARFLQAATGEFEGKVDIYSNETSHGCLSVLCAAARKSY